MKIAVIKPMDTGIYKDDTTQFIEGFESLGHGVIQLPIIYDRRNKRLAARYDINLRDEDKFSNVDIIWAPYEPLIRPALMLKGLLKCPVVGHFEVVPPAINVDSEYIRNHLINPPEEDERIKEYKEYINEWAACDGRTITDDITFSQIERLSGRMLPSYDIKPYPIDIGMLESFKEDVKTEYQILSPIRLVPHKRLHHVIKALSMITNPPKYVIIGSGPEATKLMEYAKELGVNVEFKGVVDDKTKALEIQKSMFLVCPWSWLTVGEAAALSKPSVVYYEPSTYARLGDMPVYVVNNDIEELAKTIEILSVGDKKLWDVEATGETANKILKSDITGLHDKIKASKMMIDIFKKVLGR